MKRTTLERAGQLATLLAAGLMAACGGGGAQSSPPPVGGDPTLAQRSSAASATAQSNPACRTVGTITPFYWEIGDSIGLLASGSVGAGAPVRSTAMSLASASKWVYAAYVVQKRGLRAEDVPFLNFTSGYSEFGVPLCTANDSVQACLLGRGELNPATVGKFAYDSGHMQQHAVATMGLGPLDEAALAAEVNATLGTAGLVYTQPQLAGGLAGTTTSYSAFLRRLLRGDLALGLALGQSAVCTNPATCSDAASTPNPTTEDRHYARGHWVEDDPAVGDGAFSSPGAFGYYPWIDAERRYYGVLARESKLEDQAGYKSSLCGRAIRQAWSTGVAAP